MTELRKMPDDYWLSKLTPDEYKILRRGDTEAPFTGKLLHNKETGTYRCAACGTDLFSSNAKFDSGSGWPSFDDPIAKDAVELRSDSSHGMLRTEAICRNCGSHLGHVFEDGPKETTGKRFCINSAALRFESQK
jgi:peptide-methionine (R)-S-oxide reductase